MCWLSGYWEFTIHSANIRIYYKWINSLRTVPSTKYMQIYDSVRKWMKKWKPCHNNVNIILSVKIQSQRAKIYDRLMTFIFYSLSSVNNIRRLPICVANPAWWYEYSWQCGRKQTYATQEERRSHAGDGWGGGAGDRPTQLKYQQTRLSLRLYTTTRSLPKIDMFT